MPDISSELTFVFTDIEASTRKWEEHPDAMATAVDLHDRILGEAVTAHGGTVIKLTGDGLFARFDVAADAIAASVAAQRALVEVPPSSVEPLRVRIGLHCGIPVVAGHGDYLGQTPNRCARIMAAAHGGQVVVSEAVVGSGSLPDDIELIDLGLHELRDVPEPVRLFQVHAEGLEREFPPLKTIGEHPNNLPEPVSSFVGRVKAVAQIGDLLEQRRLVTLVGPGGCGKTRLAVEAAAARVRHHADGVWLVGLADVSPSDAPSTEGVAAAVAAALGIQEEQARLLSDTVRDRLRGTEMLLVLDNCEHVLREAALFAQQVLEAGRSVRVMATGREPLGLVGEAVYVVDPLPVPDDDALSFDAEAVQLFLDRAALARPGFEPTDDDLRRIGHVCRRLDGIPLALELAAARLRALTVSQLEARLDSRFRLLVGTAAHVPRHRTLQATLDWSYDLLTVGERDAAFRLSVFAGGFDLEAASRVIDAPELETLDTLARLVDRSLLTMHDVAGAARYRMLETMREYGRDALREAGQLVDTVGRHRSWAVDLAARAEPHHMDAEGPAWHDRLELELPNLRLAVSSALADVPADAIRLAGDLGLYAWLRGHLAEGRSWCERALAAHPDAEPRSKSRALLALGELAFAQLDRATSTPALEACAELARSTGDMSTVGWAQIFLAPSYAVEGDTARALAALDEALRIAHEVETPSVRAGAYLWAGQVNDMVGEVDLGVKYLLDAIALARDVGSPYTLTRALPVVARGQHEAGDDVGAMATSTEAIELARSTGDRMGLVRSLQLKADLLIRRGEYAEAKALLDEALPIVRRQLDDGLLRCRVELNLARLHRHRAELDVAQRHLDHALAATNLLRVWQTSLDPLVQQARVYEGRGDLEAALAALDAGERFAARATTTSAWPAAVCCDPSSWPAPAGPEARAVLDDIAPWCRRAGLVEFDVLEHHTAGLVALAEGDAATAIGELHQALSDGAERGEALATVERAEELATDRAGGAATAGGDPARCGVGCQGAAGHTSHTGAPAQRIDALLASVESTLGPQACAEAVATGATARGHRRGPRARGLTRRADATSRTGAGPVTQGSPSTRRV